MAPAYSSSGAAYTRAGTDQCRPWNWRSTSRSRCTTHSTTASAASTRGAGDEGGNTQKTFFGARHGCGLWLLSRDGIGGGDELLAIAGDFHHVLARLIQRQLGAQVLEQDGGIH